jgi:NAD(P)H-binding
MNVLIFGAPGGTGMQLVNQALERGHCVTAFVQEPARLKRTHPALHCIAGDGIAPGRKPFYTTARWWLLGGAPSGSTRGTRTPAGALDQEAGREARLPASGRPLRGVT